MPFGISGCNDEWMNNIMLIRQSADVVLVQCDWVEVLLSFFPFSHRVVSLEGETIQLY